MRLSSSVALALAAALVSTGPAQAWTQVETDEFVGTYQPDSSDDYALSLSCDMAFGMYALAIESTEEWDEDEDYLETIDVSFGVDGDMLDPVAFTVSDLGGFAGLLLTELDDGFETLHDALFAASGAVTASFLDTELSFDAAGAADAFDAVDLVCWEM